jgi:hypothetical protein
MASLKVAATPPRKRANYPMPSGLAWKFDKTKHTTVRTAHNITIGSDFNPDGGNKAFAGVDTVADVEALADRLPDNRRFLYEYVRSMDHPSHLFFDFERDWSPEEAQLDDNSLDECRVLTIDSIMKQLQALLNEISDGAAEELLPGQNCQVAITRYPASCTDNFKFSCHLVVYAEGLSAEVAGRIASALKGRIAALQDTDPDYTYLTYPDGSKRNVVDMSVYRVGYFRMLRSAKSKYPGCLMVPVMGSSDNLRDHLICAHAGQNCPPPGMRFALPRVDVARLEAIAPALAKENKDKATTGKVKSGDSDEQDPSLSAPAAWTPQELAAARQALLDSPELAATLCIPPASLRFDQEYKL